MSKLMFDELKDKNRLRCETSYRQSIDAWSPTDYGCALAGECGELCNLLKKLKRNEGLDVGSPLLADVTDKMLADELADVAIYLDLLATRLGIDLGTAVSIKFNETSEKIGSAIRLL